MLHAEKTWQDERKKGGDICQKTTVLKHDHTQEKNTKTFLNVILSIWGGGLVFFFQIFQLFEGLRAFPEATFSDVSVYAKGISQQH